MAGCSIENHLQAFSEAEQLLYEVSPEILLLGIFPGEMSALSGMPAEAAFTAGTRREAVLFACTAEHGTVMQGGDACTDVGDSHRHHVQEKKQ